MVDECELKVKIGIINDGFLIFGPSGTQFRESLIEAVDIAKDEFELHAADAFRVLEDDVIEYIDKMKKRETEWKEFEEFKKSKKKTADECVAEVEKYADSPKGKKQLEEIEKAADEEEKKLGL